MELEVKKNKGVFLSLEKRLKEPRFQMAEGKGNIALDAFVAC